MREAWQRGGGYTSGCRAGSVCRLRERAQILPYRSDFPVLKLSAAAAAAATIAAAFENAWPFTPPRKGGCRAAVCKHLKEQLGVGQ